MTKPHVAIVHYTAPPIVGGVENVIAQHTRLLVDAGYPVTILTGRGGADETLARAHVVVIPELDSEHPKNLEIAHALEEGNVSRAFYELQMQIEVLLTPVCTDSDTVIIHNAFNFHFNLPLTCALHRLIDRGTIRHPIAWCHDISRYVNPHSGEAKRLGFPWALLRTFRPEVTYVAVSQQRQRLLVEVLGCALERIRVIPNGVDAQTLLGLSALGRHLVEDLYLFASDVILLMPIRITRAKNIEFALRVTAALKTFAVRPKLIVTGPPDPHSPGSAAYVHELLALRREPGLDEEVVFIHEGTTRILRPLILDPATVAELYRISDLVLMPSHREGFGLPVLEAGLVGKPMFCAEMPVLDQVGRDSVYRIEPDESPAQVAARIHLWAQQDTLHRLRRRVRQDFTWSAIFTRVIELLLLDFVQATEESP